MKRHAILPGCDDHLRVHVLEFERGKGTGDRAGDRVGAQFCLTPRRDGGDLHQVIDILMLIGLHPDVFVRPCDQAAETVDVGGLFRHAMDEGMGDEPDLIQRVGHRRDLGDRVQIHVAVLRVARIHIAMRARPGPHDEPAIRSRQVHVQIAPLARKTHPFRRRRQRLGDHLARQAQPVGIPSLLRARLQEGAAGGGVQHHDAVIRQYLEHARLERVEIAGIEKSEPRARAISGLLPECAGGEGFALRCAAAAPGRSCPGLLHTFLRCRDRYGTHRLC